MALRYSHGASETWWGPSSLMAVVISNKEKVPETWGPGGGNKGLFRAGARCYRNTGFRKWPKTSSSLAADETQSRMHMHTTGARNTTLMWLLLLSTKPRKDTQAKKGAKKHLGVIFTAYGQNSKARPRTWSRLRWDAIFEHRTADLPFRVKNRLICFSDLFRKSWADRMKFNWKDARLQVLQWKSWKMLRTPCTKPTAPPTAL